MKQLMLILSIFKAESLKCYQFGTGSDGNVSLVENPSFVTSANLSSQLTEQNVVTCPVADTSCITVEFPENGQSNCQ